MRNSAASGETLTGSVSLSIATGAASDAPPFPLRGGDGDAQALPRQLLAFTADRALGLMIVRALADANLRIDLATTAEKAHALLHEGSYHAAIIDLQLPAQAGLELVTLLRAISPACACLVLSSSRTVAAAVTALKEGAADFMLKPVQPEILRHKAGALLLASPPVVASRWHVERSARGFAGMAKRGCSSRAYPAVATVVLFHLFAHCVPELFHQRIDIQVIASQWNITALPCLS